MKRHKGRVGMKVVLSCLAATLVLSALPTESQATEQSHWLSAMASKQEDTVLQDQAMENKEFWGGLSVGVEYTLVSDYIWRGINFSDYQGESGDRVNHQLDVGFEIDPAYMGLPGIGVFGGNIWFEWYSGERQRTAQMTQTGDPYLESALQEVDYTIYWAYPIEQTGLTVELGWIAYHFPSVGEAADEGLTGFDYDSAYIHEAYGKLSWDDSVVFGQPIFNPYMAYYLEIDDYNYSWIEFGISHDLVFSELGMDAMPVLKDTTLTPSIVLTVDHRMYDKLFEDDAIGTRLGYIEFGLAMDVDLSSALAIPAHFGSWSTGAFLNYTCPFHDSFDDVEGVLWGGWSLGWEF